MAEIKLLQHASNIMDECCRIIDNPDKIINILENNIIPIVKECKYTRSKEIMDNRSHEQMQNCNTLFNSYIDTLSNTLCSEEDINQSYNTYQIERNNLTRLTFQEHEKSYRTILYSKDDKKLWDKINWSGSLNNKNTTGQPLTHELAEHFRDLYQPHNDENIDEI